MKKTFISVFTVACILMSVFAVGVSARNNIVNGMVISEVTFSQNDTVLDTIVPGNVTASFKALNCDINTAVSIRVAPLLFRGNKLENIAYDAVTFAKGEEKTITADFNIPSDGNYEAKLLIWDEDLQPYAYAATLSSESRNKNFTVSMKVNGLADDVALDALCNVSEDGSYIGNVDNFNKTITFEIPYIFHKTLPYRTTFSSSDGRPAYTADDLKDVSFSFATNANVISDMDGLLNLDISENRPSFTLTAADGSSETYKVKIFRVYYADDFENGYIDGSGKWTPEWFNAMTCRTTTSGNNVGSDLIDQSIGKYDDDSQYLILEKKTTNTDGRTSALRASLDYNSYYQSGGLNGKVAAKFDYKLISSINIDGIPTPANNAYLNMGLVGTYEPATGDFYNVAFRPANNNNFNVGYNKTTLTGNGRTKASDEWHSTEIIYNTTDKTGEYYCDGSLYPVTYSNGALDSYGTDRVTKFGITMHAARIQAAAIDNLKIGLILD